MISMDKGVGYHTFKTTKDCYHRVGLIHIHWLVQSQDLNHIKSF